MGSVVCYVVQEKNKSGQITSAYRTYDYFMALADLMLKLKKPLNVELRKKCSADKSAVYIDDCVLAPDFFEYVNISFVVADKQNLCRLLTVAIDTALIGSDEDIGFLPVSDPAYRTESYFNSVKTIARRLREWSCDDYDVARVISVCATRDPSHIFWLQRKQSVKKLEL